MVPVNLQDQHLLGVQWESAVCIDKAFPFGLRSAAKIFQQLLNRTTECLFVSLLNLSCSN